MLVVALDTNGDYRIDSSTTYNLRTDFSLRSAAAVVTGTSKAGREFVIVSSSGYYNSANPNDPNNEPSPGVILLVRDPNTGGFDNSRTRELVSVGDNRLLQRKRAGVAAKQRSADCGFPLRRAADHSRHGRRRHARHALHHALLFLSLLRMMRRSTWQSIRAALCFHIPPATTRSCSRFTTTTRTVAPIETRFAWKVFPSTTIFFFTGSRWTVRGNVYVIEDASGLADGSGGNGGTPRIDAFPDRFQDGFLSDGSIFQSADDAISLALSGLGVWRAAAEQDRRSTILRDPTLPRFSKS